MFPVGICRRAFLVPLANNDHGKTKILLSLVNHGERRNLQKLTRAARLLYTPWGRPIDSLVFPRSYQETLKAEFGSVQGALDSVDPGWTARDLVVLPSHLDPNTCSTMIEIAHAAGFQAIAVSVLLSDDEIPAQGECLALGWDHRWTLANARKEEPEGQLRALGSDLWVWTAIAIANP